MKIQLVSTENDFYDFDIIDASPFTRIKVPSEVKNGDTCNVYYGESSKAGVVWQGKNGIQGYLIGDVERSIVVSEIYKEFYNPNPEIKTTGAETITTLILGTNLNAHQITAHDRFLDNGACVQLLKATPMKTRYAGDSLVLDENALATIAQYQRINHSRSEFHRDYPNTNFQVFSLVSDEERFLVMGYPTKLDVENKTGHFLGGDSRYSIALSLKDSNLVDYYQVKIFNSRQQEVEF